MISTTKNAILFLKNCVLPPPLSFAPQVSLCYVQGTRLLAGREGGAALLLRPKKDALITALF